MTSNEFADAADCCYGCNTMYNLSIYIFNLFIRSSWSSFMWQTSTWYLYKIAYFYTCCIQS